MVADERIHEEVVRALATRGRQRLSGTFRAAVFGANDGLVSNLALVLGISAAGVPNHVVLLTGVAGLLAGALSMGAGEYVSVRSQRELLDASTPDPAARDSLPDLDVDANELALVYRARGMTSAEAQARATEVLAGAVVRARSPSVWTRRRPCRSRLDEAIAQHRTTPWARHSAPRSRASCSSRRGRSCRSSRTCSACRASRRSSSRPCSSASRCSARAPSSDCCRERRRSSARCASSRSATAPRPRPTCSGCCSASAG